MPRWLSALSTLALSAAVGVGSVATLPSALARSTGAPAVLNSKGGDAIVRGSGMGPGDSRTGTVDIGNGGSGAATLALSRSVTDSDAAHPLSRALGLTVADCGRWAGGAPPACASPVRVYSGTVAGMGTQALGEFGAGERHRYRFVMRYPRGAGNAHQGAGMKLRFDWSAVSR